MGVLLEIKFHHIQCLSEPWYIIFRWPPYQCFVGGPVHLDLLIIENLSGPISVLMLKKYSRVLKMVILSIRVFGLLVLFLLYVIGRY